MDAVSPNQYIYYWWGANTDYTMTGTLQKPATTSETELEEIVSELRALKIPALPMHPKYDWHDNNGTRVLVAAPETHLVIRNVVKTIADTKYSQIEWVNQLPNYTLEDNSDDPIPNARSFDDVKDLENRPQAGGRIDAITTH